MQIEFDDILNFPRISCKLSPVETICMKCQRIVSGKNKKTNSKCRITKTYLYNFDPLKPHFYIVKLGFTWVHIISLISAQKHRLWVLSENFPFLVVKF